MTRSVYSLLWRVVLAISLATGPWPPAAWAGLGDATMQSESIDCHGMNASPADSDAIAAPSGAPCEDGCCDNPACDPSHCIPLHASPAMCPAPARFAVLAPGFVPAFVAIARGDPPRQSPLRPPIG